MRFNRNIFIKNLAVIICVFAILSISGCKKSNDVQPAEDQTVTAGPEKDAEQQTKADNGTGMNTDGSSSDQNTGITDGTDAADNTDGTADTDTADNTGGTADTDIAGKTGNTGDVSSADNTAGTDEMSELMRLYALTVEGMQPVDKLSFPADSSVYSRELAVEALSLCSQGTKQMMTKYLTSSGFEVLLQAGYDKDKSDPSHTCAFTLAKKDIVLNGRSREMLLISIRGTEAGEWFSNFDFAASHSDDTAFAENFLQAAQDVYVRILPRILEYPDAVLLVCGHSRGAACANLLGMTLDDLRSKENVYVYTFATPGTIRGEYDAEKYTNIFNLINPADLVTYLPIAGWGYKRVGNDIILNGDPQIASQLKNDMDLLAAFSPSISDYYGTKHRIEGLEGFDKGITTYETMLALASSMTGIESDEVKGLKVTDLYKLAGSNTAAGELYPLLNFLKNMVGTDGNMNLNVFKQHMPAVYRELIAAD